MVRVHELSQKVSTGLGPRTTQQHMRQCCKSLNFYVPYTSFIHYSVHTVSKYISSLVSSRA